MVRPRLPSNLHRIVALSLIFALLAAIPSWSADTDDQERLRARALELVNRDRAEHGLPPLAFGSDLNTAALRHAKDMLRRGYYSHVSPEGGTAMDRYIEAGGSRWRLVEENIARCPACDPPPAMRDIDQLQQGWMSSPTHRENILARGIDRFGFGIVADADQGIYAVQAFAGPGRPRGLAPNEEPEVLPAAAQVRNAVERINRARRENGAPPLQASDTLTEGARSLLPQGSRDAFDLQQADDILAAMSSEQRAQWLSVSAIAGICGGCGTEPTTADLRFFTDQWLEDGRYRGALLDPHFTHLGFVLQADGAGRKIALAALGSRR